MADGEKGQLDHLLDRVEAALAVESVPVPCAFLEAESGLARLDLPAPQDASDRNALAAIVLHHMLKQGADCCALAVADSADPLARWLDGHAMGPDGVRSVRRRYPTPERAAASPAGTARSSRGA